MAFPFLSFLTCSGACGQDCGSAVSFLLRIWLKEIYWVLFVFLQEYGINKEEKLEIAIGFCLPLIKKIQLDLQRTHEDESVNKLHPL